MTRDILLDLLEAGLLRIRAAAWAGDSRRCEVECDHIHNLPSLARQPKDEGLHYYWNVERPAFLADCLKDRIDVQAFAELWQELALFVQRIEEHTEVR